MSASTKTQSEEEVCTLTGHSDSVNTLIVLPNGQLASGSDDNTIKLWDVERHICLVTLTGHSDSVWTLIVLPNGQLASGSADDTIKLWDVERHICLVTLTGHSDTVRTLIVLPNGQLASGSADDTIKLWDVERHICLVTLTGHSDWVITLIVLPNGQLASGSADKTIKLWDVERHICLVTLTGHSDTVYTLIVLPNGQLASGSLDKTIKLWDVERHICLVTLTGHSNSVRTLIVLPNGQLASGSADDTIKLWDVMSNMTTEATAGNEVKLPQISAQKKSCDEKLPSREDLAKQIEVLQAQLAKEQLVEKDNATKVPEYVEENEVLKLPPIVSSKVIMSNGSEADDLFDVNATSKGADSLFIAERDVVLGRELGRGGFGVVYEGTYAFEPVAVKTYYGTSMPEKEFREIQREVYLMKQLNSRYLVRLIGLVLEENTPAKIIMEYGSNGSLFNYLHSFTDIPWSLRLRMAEELSRGLGYLHHKKIIHRDIKSLNIVLDQDLHAKWCDFGLAVLKLHTTTTSKQETQSPVGTTRWMAPELFSRKTSSPSTASDIWALGMVFFELASREVPFADAKDNDQVKDFIKEGTGEDVPEDCQINAPKFGELMQRCWAERTQRPSAGDLVTQLTQLVSTFKKISASHFKSTN